MKKKLLLVLMLITAVVVMPRVHAADAIELDDVTDITNVNTLKSEEDETTRFLDKTDLSNVTITYEVAKFQLLDNGSSESVSRPDGYAWIGFRVKNAKNATKYSVKFNGEEVAEIKEKSVSNSSFDDYIGFKEEDLKAAAEAGINLEFTYEITWEGDEEVEPVTQTIKVVVVPKGIVLLEKQPEDETPAAEVWNEETYKENVKKVTVTVKVMKDGKEVKLEKPLSYTLPATYALSEDQVAEIQKALTDKDVDLVGLYTDEDLKNEFDPEAELTENTTVYIVYKTKVAEEEAPDTIDNAVMYIALAGASLLVASGVAIYYKRFN